MKAGLAALFALAPVLVSCASTDFVEVSGSQDESSDEDYRDRTEDDSDDGGSGPADDGGVTDPGDDGGDPGPGTGSGEGESGDGDGSGAGLPPVARTPDRIDGRLGDELTFDGSESSDPDGEIVDYRWSFGDGDEGVGSLVTHDYLAPGDYDASLTVEDDDGNTDVATVLVRVSDSTNLPPTAVIGLPDEPVLIGEEIALDGRASNDPDGSIVSYEWELTIAATSDTVTRSGAVASYAFVEWGEVEVRLQVTDNVGAVGVDLQSLHVAGPPMAGFVLTPESVTVGSPINMDASLSSDPDGEIVSYEWDLGDGNEAAGISATHTYSAPGAYDITLTVVDDDGLEDHTTALATVVAPANQAPVAAIDVLTAAPTVGEPVSFGSSRSSDPDGEIVGWAWDFGDGDEGDGPSVSHTFSTPGSHTVRLTVTDGDGTSGTATETLTVADSGGTDPPSTIDGTWQVRPYDTEDEYTVDCNLWVTFIVGPGVCDMAQSGSSLTMDCGGDFVYSGSRSGDDFTLSMIGGTIDTLDCGTAFVDETISGSFESDSLWQGTVDELVFTFSDPFCDPCSVLPFPKTGRRL